jgi:4-diphosphocytidyl-2-C-methyl-D-erythritol kinase
VVAERYPEVAEALAWLGQYAKAMMTGTGACVFAAFDSRSAAEEVLEKLPAGWQAFAAHGVNRSPLLARLAEAEA